jgi:hypothetical protein
LPKLIPAEDAKILVQSKNDENGQRTGLKKTETDQSLSGNGQKSMRPIVAKPTYLAFPVGKN